MLIAGWTVALWPTSEDLLAIYSPAAVALNWLGLVPVAHIDSAVMVIEIVLNVLVYIPFSCIVYLGLKRNRIAIAVGFSLALSICGELAQLMFVPSRVPSLFDVLENFLGALIGIAIAPLLKKKTSFDAP